MFLHVSEKECTIIKNNSIDHTSSMRVEYKDCVCNKPWGYEFLAYESNRIGVWYLRINRGHGTSLHTHFKKDTLIFVIAGTAKVTLIDNEIVVLPPLSFLHIPKRKFHALSSFSDEVYLMEIEIFDRDVTFTDKNDLLRIDDQYNRKRTGYESSVNVTTENLDDFDHFTLTDAFTKTIFGTTITVSKTYKATTNGHTVLLDGTLFCNGKYYKEGSIITDLEFQSKVYNNLFLTIENAYSKEDSKIIYSTEQLIPIVKKVKAQNKKIILTSGCYDILHVGHIHNLKVAKSLGDLLFVCLSSDEQIKKLKGETRPVNTYKDRITLFKTLAYIDYIIIYNEENIEKEETLGQIMKLVNPDIWTKGDDYTVEKIAEKHPYLNSIIIIDNIKDKSTTNIINKITANAEKGQI